MSYTDLRDFDSELSVSIPQMNDGDKTLSIQIEKLGGGTVGKSYTGTWRYRVLWAGKEVYKAQDLETPTPTSHEEAASLIAGFLANYGDPDSDIEFTGPMPTGRYKKLCDTQYERLRSYEMEVIERLGL